VTQYEALKQLNSAAYAMLRYASLPYEETDCEISLQLQDDLDEAIRVYEFSRYMGVRQSTEED
jgi:hypothetical protein